MRKFHRLISPSVLEEEVDNPRVKRWVKYGNRYSSNKIANKSHLFQWPKVRGVYINNHILPTLRQQTEDHCSYCDSYPLTIGESSIDHFYPKSNHLYYHLVCQWENLYYACSHCQKTKLEKHNPFVLRPDEIGFSFVRYFTYNYFDHIIEVNPKASVEEKLKAEVTINFFNFNETALKISRRHSFERYCGLENPIIEDFNFRFLYE